MLFYSFILYGKFIDKRTLNVMRARAHT